MSYMLTILVLMLSASTHAADTNPMSMVLHMIEDLQGTVLRQASEAQKEYNKYVKFCQERSQSLQFEIKNGRADKDNLKANIEKEGSDVETFNSKIEDLSSDLSSDDVDLKAATSLRAKEAEHFADEESDITTIVSAFERAISHFSKNGQAALLQTKSTNSVTDALHAMVDALAMSAEDASRLTALVQEHSLQNGKASDDDDGDDDDDLGPKPQVYKNAAGGIVATMEGLLERAQDQLGKVRAAEATAIQNYQKLKLAVSAEMKAAEQDMHAAKVGLAESIEAKSVAVGDLDITSKDLDNDVASKEALHHQCMDVAQEFQTAVHARDTELKALAAGRKALEESSDGAVQQTYAPSVSFAQLASRTKAHASSGIVGFQVVRLIRKLSKTTKSAALAQLASRMSSALKLGSGNRFDPFEKVRGLLEDMLSQLNSDADADSSHRAYCDKETAATNAQKDDTSSDLSALSAKTDQDKARSVKLLEQSRTLQQELASIARFQAEAEELRFEQKAAFEKDRAEMQKGLQGVQVALKILKEHYGNSVGAEGGIISLLEVVESDFTQGLTGLVVDEDTAAHQYTSQTKPDFELETAAKENDLQHKKKEYMRTNKHVAESNGDISGLQSRLTAINEFDTGLKKTCTSEPDYVERRRRREQELAGLKEAMVSLAGGAGGAVLLETGSSHKLRGARPHNSK